LPRSLLSIDSLLTHTDSPKLLRYRRIRGASGYIDRLERSCYVPWAWRSHCVVTGKGDGAAGTATEVQRPQHPICPAQRTCGVDERVQFTSRLNGRRRIGPTTPALATSCNNHLECVY